MNPIKFDGAGPVYGPLCKSCGDEIRGQAAYEYDGWLYCMNCKDDLMYDVFRDHVKEGIATEEGLI